MITSLGVWPKQRLSVARPIFRLAVFQWEKCRSAVEGYAEKTRNEGRTHDVVDNKGPIFLKHTMFMKTNEILNITHDIYETKGFEYKIGVYQARLGLRNRLPPAI